MNRKVLGLALALALASRPDGVDAQPANSAKPDGTNIVLLLADDLGHGDLGCYGCPDIRTPNIDRLARQGTRFTTFYANAPECTPTRTALLTGRYQQRVGGLECALGLGNVGRYDDAIRLREAHDLGLPPADSELAKRLKAAGYSTAIVGKWHLGYERKFLPDLHGFDQSFGPLGGATDYFFHSEPDGQPVLYRNGQPTEKDGYLTDLISDEAAAFIHEHADRPFFLYVPFNAPHDPFQGPDDRHERPVTLAESHQGSRETYRAMVERMDQGVGRILQAIDDSGVSERTLVIFSSDNGGAKYARNAPFSGGKGGLFEGGIRVPCIARWPGVLAEGAESNQMGITMDLTASIVQAAGAEPPQDRPFDGVALLQAIAENRKLPPRPLFWRARRGERTWRAIRDGDLKYITRTDAGQVNRYLFDLAQDPSEKHNLIDRRKEDANRLEHRLAVWEHEVRPAR